ncbi:Shiga-like toxin beta subunit, partial [Escherichia coli]|nr:Shiga-like toxin beta subunit [Escherichia coli]EEZ2476620.1 Shiga-like toxin beta subunit [Escherichia coli O157:H7]EFC0825591.1 Shiga-like toxin beta subunit [Escherichia coli]EHW7755582.1 Shiga-like toxin beta subunit [Escherichia coli]EHX3964927.1 Shiga-like toxin beta subunit [Escherichia coli]
MKKTLLIAASLSFFSASALATPDCVTGKVEYTKYNDDDTFTVK